MAPIRRLEEEALVTTRDNSNLPTTTSREGSQEIPINGMGVAGIAIFIIFLSTVLIAITCLNGIFVNTKFIDTPLLLGKIEY
jgi:hypothetical protein